MYIFAATHVERDMHQAAERARWLSLDRVCQQGAAMRVLFVERTAAMHFATAVLAILLRRVVAIILACHRFSHRAKSINVHGCTLYLSYRY